MSKTEFPEGSWTVLRLPRSHWHCQLSNFVWPRVRPDATRARVASFLEGLEAQEAPHLIFTGDPGIGKSHLGVALYRQGVRLYGTAHTTWVNVPRFCDQVKGAFDGRGFDPFESYREARKLVVLDDLFGRELTNYEVSQIVTRMIDIAYLNGAAVVLTMNPEVSRIATYLGQHEASRVLAGSTIIPLKSDRDWRVARDHG